MSTSKFQKNGRFQKNESNIVNKYGYKKLKIIIYI